MNLLSVDLADIMKQIIIAGKVPQSY
jgi:hypothetical protein